MPINRAGFLISWHRPLSFEATVITADCSSLLRQITGGHTCGFCWAFSDGWIQSLLVPHSPYCLLSFVLLCRSFLFLSVHILTTPCPFLYYPLSPLWSLLIPLTILFILVPLIFSNLLNFYQQKYIFFLWYWSQKQLQYLSWCSKSTSP